MDFRKNQVFRFFLSLFFWNLFHFFENYSAKSEIKSSIERLCSSFLLQMSS